ncbi:type 2 lanthipeptide synthetase LanM family protein [Pseudonocardia halophobica]|uniref:type 2 lanthipeptide synthetase LanM family protein n=1 Tax=Pseudonocardia halophobica TaxID=29401 RepID=UPI003D9033B7
MSLTERLGAGTTTAPPRIGDGDVEKAQRRLRAWKTQKPFAKAPLFAQRLAADYLSEQDFLALLGESDDSLQARTPRTPPWMAALRDALRHPRPTAALVPVLGEVETDHPLAGCLPALGPLLERAVATVEGRVRALTEEHDAVPVDRNRLSRMVVTNIAPTLLFQVSKPLILELHIARLEGRLEGDTPQARFADFLRWLDQEEGLVSLLAKYPVLARQIVTSEQQWADYLCEVFANLCADWNDIRTVFADGGDPGLLVEVDAGKGDRHREGRSVLLLKFSSGLRLLYKPKPLAADVHFQELLSWLNDNGAEPRLRPLVLLDKGDYGWSEFVPTSSCGSRDEVARFYQRQGGYLALLYALDAADLHNENLIAAGEHPMLVDLEALFHPRVHGKDPTLENLAASALDQSVWQVGLLPRRVWSDENSVGVDMSGLGGNEGQMNPHQLVGWDQPGTDEMRLVRRNVELPVSENRPRLRGREVDVLDYKDDIVAGFTRMYRLLCGQKDALLAERLPRFAHDEIRVVVRNTNVYGLLWYESFHPDLLRDALERERFFDRLWQEVPQHPYLKRIIAAERQDLLRGDIPLFRGFPDSTTILTSEGEPLVDFLDAPSLDSARRRVEQLGEADLTKQTWVVEASLATLLMDRENTIARPARLPRGTGHVPRARLVALADGFGKRLGELALQDDSGAYWLGVGPLDDTTWGVYPSGHDLYAGTGGIALFLGYLGAITGESSHTLLARRGVAALRAQLQAWREAGIKEDGDAYLPTVGGYEGLGSLVYVLSSLGALWQEQSLLDDAEDLVEVLPALISADTSLDIVYGSAGCLLSLLSLHALRPSRRTSDLAIHCGERLLATAQPTSPGTAWTTLKDQPLLGGFSHGTAGIALSLLRLTATTGEDRFRKCALQALDFDRSLYVPELHNWADLRVFPSRRPEPETADAATASRRQFMVAWCHGAPGIGLGRLAALDELDDEAVRGEIDSALAATLEYGFAMNHSLCHGALGNLELLLSVVQRLGRPQDQEALDRATAVVVDSIETNGPATGVPLGVETPGFMTGLAGIGYQLLRLAEPDTVPSALLLAPPR